MRLDCQTTVFITMLSDNVKGRVQQPDGSYRLPEQVDTPLNSQELLCDRKLLVCSATPTRIDVGDSCKFRCRAKLFYQEAYGEVQQ